MMQNNNPKNMEEAVQLVKRMQGQIDELRLTVRQFEQEEELHNDLRRRLAKHLDRVAFALKGPNPPNGLHSWHDLGELVDKKLARIRELEARLEIDPKHNYDGIACRDVTIRELEETIEKKDKQIQALLNHCEDAECLKCGEIICPYGEPLHFHHDGCPACAEREGI